jgi:hypothetical protein
VCGRERIILVELFVLSAEQFCRKAITVIDTESEEVGDKVTVEKLKRR